MSCEYQIRASASPSARCLPANNLRAAWLRWFLFVLRGSWLLMPSLEGHGDYLCCGFVA